MSDLKPGKYRMTVEVEVDEEGYLLPHDSGEMFMADWWVQNEATFEPVPPPQCNECGWWLTTNPASCPSCGAPTGLGVSGEGQSEPTPAPCSAKGVNHDTRAIVDCELHEGHEGTHQQGDNFWRAGAPEHVLAALRSEVVTPEGTP